MPVPAGAYAHGPSCWDRVKFGFISGFCVGVTTGALLGAFSTYRCGLRGREFLQSVSKIMFQGGGTFGLFMAIGSGIRC